MPGDLATLVLDAVGPHRPGAGLVLRSRWAPFDTKVVPPSLLVRQQTRTGTRQQMQYLVEQRWIWGEGAPVDVVVLDHPASQANRVEVALVEARDEGLIRGLPVGTQTASTQETPHPSPQDARSQFERSPLVLVLGSAEFPLCQA